MGTIPFPAKPGKRQPLFDIRSLYFRYPNGQWGVKGIDLAVFEGDRVARVGQNGSGKTTFIKHLNGLFRAQKGTVLYKGKPLEGGHLKRARLEIGILFQDPDDHLFCNTLYEDIAFGPMNQGLSRDEIDSRVKEALGQVGLDSLAYKAPHNLSYGQKKRAALAALLAMKPQVLILDEPTANLDPKQEKIFLELLQAFSGTLICISHDLFFLYGLCSRAVVLKNGEIHHDYSFKELVSHRPSLREHGLDFTFRFRCCNEHNHAYDGNNGLQRHRSVTGSFSTKGSAPLTGEHVQTEETGQYPLIQLADYSYRYQDGTWGLRKVNLSLFQGERLALVGENGAGKSTLATCLMMGILEGQGKYIFKGRPVAEKSRKRLWRWIGLVFQDSTDQIFCPSCWQEVAFGPKQLGLSSQEVKARVDEALSLVRLEGYENRVPHHLSSGERKRLAIAAVLSMRPQVLILDEPTAHLDPQSEELLMEILNALDVTQILISHDIWFISMLCNRTMVMHRGRIIRNYTTKDFLEDERLVSINGLDYTFKNNCCQETMKMHQAEANAPTQV